MNIEVPVGTTARADMAAATGCHVQPRGKLMVFVVFGVLPLNTMPAGNPLRPGRDPTHDVGSGGSG